MEKKSENAIRYFPYPLGEERKKIFTAMEEFIETLKRSETLEKALSVMVGA